MPTTQADSLGVQFADRFGQARRELGRALSQGARELPCLVGLNPNGTAVVPLENLFSQATDYLTATGQFYHYGQNIALEVTHGEERSLQLLTLGSRAEPIAAAMISNFLTCQTVCGSNSSPMHFTPPSGFINNLLARFPTRAAFPPITTYARRPVYDEHFILRGPGYHAEPQILVHGFDIEPTLPMSRDCRRLIPERLPPHIRTLFGGFCFRGDADVANGLGAMLTGVLGNHFVRQPKANVNIDANQVGTGKTWLALAIGAIMDGQLPNLIHYTPDDEELAKRVLANLRKRPTSILLIDNAKNRGGVAISSPFIEANSVAPEISLRILGQSANYSQQNDVLWFLTMNQTKLDPDLASRGMPIRLFYEGDPAQRVFDGPNPLDYALAHRGEILGELFGMIELWKSSGLPSGSHPHRCTYWAQVIGGILEACGFPEFLGNAAEAAAEFNTELGDLAALAEYVVRNGTTTAFTVVARQS
jgi:hypothetical protein